MSAGVSSPRHCAGIGASARCTLTKGSRRDACAGDAGLSGCARYAPQPPQSPELVEKSAQYEVQLSSAGQATRLAGHSHVPETHGLLQQRPQLPQFIGSIARFTQRPLHQADGGTQASADAASRGPASAEPESGAPPSARPASASRRFASRRLASNRAASRVGVASTCTPASTAEAPPQPPIDAHATSSSVSVCAERDRRRSRRRPQPAAVLRRSHEAPVTGAITGTPGATL